MRIESTKTVGQVTVKQSIKIKPDKLVVQKIEFLNTIKDILQLIKE